MKFVSLAAASLAFALPAFAQTVKSVTYDMTYDQSTYPVAGVACSNGANGLLTKGYTTLGSLPNFPNIGGAYTVTGWNSPACGTCYELTYGSKKIAILAVDTAGEGFNISEEAMKALTGDVGIEAGKVSVNVTQVAASVCGL